MQTIITTLLYNPRNHGGLDELLMRYVGLGGLHIEIY